MSVIMLVKISVWSLDVSGSASIDMCGHLMSVIVLVKISVWSLDVSGNASVDICMVI
jgi:hypothetical protein